MAEQSADIPDGYPTEKQLRDELERLRKRERFLRSILETQDEMLCRFLPDTTLTFRQRALLPHVRTHGGGAAGHAVPGPHPGGQPPGVMETISQLSASNRIITYSHEVRLPDGSIGWQQWTDTAIIDGDGNVTEIQSTGRDITRQKLVERELVLQTRLQELLMSISATYISIPETEVDEAIHRSLAELGQFSGADRFYIFEYDFRRNTSNNTYEWCAPGIEPQIDTCRTIPTSTSRTGWRPT
jgi:PAS domain S-box-containing protein